MLRCASYAVRVSKKLRGLFIYFLLKYIISLQRGRARERDKYECYFVMDFQRSGGGVERGFTTMSIFFFFFFSVNTFSTKKTSSDPYTPTHGIRWEFSTSWYLKEIICRWYTLSVCIFFFFQRSRENYRRITRIRQKNTISSNSLFIIYLFDNRVSMEITKNTTYTTLLKIIFGCD